MASHIMVDREGGEMAARGKGTREDPWLLKTPPGTSEYQMWKDEDADPPALICQVGKTTLSYRLRCLDDLHAMLKQRGDWMPLGSADEQKPAAEGTPSWKQGSGRGRAPSEKQPNASSLSLPGGGAA